MPPPKAQAQEARCRRRSKNHLHRRSSLSVGQCLCRPGPEANQCKLQQIMTKMKTLLQRAGSGARTAGKSCYRCACCKSCLCIHRLQRVLRGSRNLSLHQEGPTQTARELLLYLVACAKQPAQAPTFLKGWYAAFPSPQFAPVQTPSPTMPKSWIPCAPKLARQFPNQRSSPN